VAPEGLLVDYGGVLTTNVFAAFGGFCDREGLDRQVVALAFREDPVARGALEELELGTLGEEEFSVRLAGALGLPHSAADGLIARLWSDLGPDQEMIDAVGAAHAAGIRTGLISNSWGTALEYEPALMARLFDATVISHVEGLRKPDPTIYALGAQRLGLAPEACVFVDDLRGNLKPARTLGMTTIHHTTAAETIPQLEELLGVALR
jgi:putative hydrolase of the HAD superfamily